MGGPLRVPWWLFQRILAMCLDWGVRRESKSQKWIEGQGGHAPTPEQPLLTALPAGCLGFQPSQPFFQGLVHLRGDHYLPCPTAREVPRNMGFAIQSELLCVTSKHCPLLLCSLV